MPIPALVGLTSAAYQYYQGVQQKKMAKDLKPSNYIPPSVQKAVTESESMAQKSTMPGYNRATEKLRISTANTIDNAKKISGNAGQVQQAVADSDAREKELIKDLEVSNANFTVDAKRNANNMSLVKGEYEQRSMDAYNAAKSALTGSSARNKFNAVQTLGEGIIYSLPDSQFDGKGTPAGGGPTATSAMDRIDRRVTGAGINGDIFSRYKRVLGNGMSSTPASIRSPQFDFRKYLSDLGLNR